MEKNKILCFKICYLLGMNSTELSTQFRFLNQCAREIKYFDDKKNSQLFRRLSRIYFNFVMKSSRILKSGDFNKYLKGMLTSEGLASCDKLGVVNTGEFLSFLNGISVKSNSLISSVFDELQPGMLMRDFDNLLYRRDVTVKQLYEMEYLLRSAPEGYSFLFFNSYVCNHNVVKLMERDSNLRKRLRTANCDIALEDLKDTSSLMNYIEQKLESRFFNPEDISRFSRVFVHCSRGDQQYSSILRDIDYSVIDTLSAATFTKLSSDCVVICDSEHNTISQHILHACRQSGAAIVLQLPVPTSLYKSVMNGEYSNVYFLSDK